MAEKQTPCDWRWLELNDMRENCLRHLENVQSFFMTGYEENKLQKQQTQEDPVQQTNQAVDTDIRITNFALNQTLYPDGNTDVNTEIQRRTVLLRSKEIRILIAGEVATGKSTLMNVLMGGPFLPTDHFHCTAVVCELHLSLERRAVIFFRDEEMVPLLVNNLSDSPDENTQPNKHGTGWEQVWYYIKESHETSDIFRVELYWPMPFIKHLLTLRPTTETHRNNRHESLSNGRVDDNSSWPYVTRLRELKFPHDRSPGDGKSASGSFREGLPDSPEAAKYHLHGVDVLPKIYSDEEGEDSFPRADKTNKDVSKQPKDSENISFEKKNSRQEIDITEYHSNIERRDETDTEETTPKRVCSPLDQLPVDMTSEHLHPIDINVIVSQDIDRSHRPVLQDGDAENPDEENAFIYPRDSTDETSRRNFGTFSAGADEAPEAVNVVFCDCPGISENEQTFGPTLDNVEKSHGIILVVDAYKANAGIEEGKVLKLLHRIQDRLYRQGVMLQNVPLMCICNKMDMLNDITKQEVEDTVRQIVNDKFPTTQDVPVRFFGARKLLEKPRDCEKVTDGLQSFLKQGLYSEVVKQHVWMMNLLDLTMTLRKEKGKLVEKLKHLDDDTCKEAINLLQRVNDLEITSGEIASCKNQMKRYLSSSKPLFKLQWSSDEEKELVQHRHASWNSISNKIDKEILRKINQKIEEDGQLSEFRSLKNKYIKLRKAAFQPHLKELDRIKKATDINENNHRTLKDLAVPVAAPASAIVASRFIPHHGMMLATPLIGLLLLGYGAFEEYRDWQDDKEKARFERDKTGYLESRTNSKIEDLIKDLSAEGDDEKRFSKLSDTFRAIFGDSIRKHILDELSIIIQNCLSGKTMVSHIKQKHADVSDEFRIKLFNKFQEIHTSFLDLCRLQTIEGDCGAEVMHLGDYARRLYQQRNKPVFEVVKSCTTVKYGTDTSKQLKLCEEYLFSCCQTSRNLQNNILLLKDAGVLVVDTYPPELYLIYEDCQSNLAKFITSNPLVKEMGQRRKQEKEFYELGVQIVQAIHHLHSRGVCHGNLNPDNILLTESNSEITVKLGSKGSLVHTWLHTEDHYYVPPDHCGMLNISSSQESDICSVGFILLELWYRKTVENLRKTGIDIHKIADKNASLILRGCLQQDPSKRWKSHALLDKFQRCLNVQ